MRKATVAKLSLTAMVGLGTLLGQAATAEAKPPQPNGGVIIAQPTTTTTMKPLVAVPVNPCAPITCLEAEEVDPTPEPPKDKAPVPQPAPGCQPNVLCDEYVADEGCTWTHGCPEDPEPGCPANVLCDELTSDPGCTITHGECPGGGDEGTDGGDEGTDDGGDEGTDGGDEGTDGEDGTTGGTTGGGSLPKTGAELATWAIAGVGLTGAGAALRKLGKRGA